MSESRGEHAYANQGEHKAESRGENAAESQGENAAESQGEHAAESHKEHAAESHGEHAHENQEEEAHEHHHFEGDYYELLEVTKQATSEEIKKSYQRLAMLWHPDKNPDKTEKAKRMFQDLGEAYEILSDDHKRESYDKYGREGMRDHGGEESDEEEMGCGCCAGASDPFTMFQQMFGDIDPYALVMRSMVMGGGMRGMMGGMRGMGMVGRNALVLRRPRRTAMSPYGMPNGLQIQRVEPMQRVENDRAQMAGYVPNSNTTTRKLLPNGQTIIVRRVVNNGVETTTTYDRNGTLIDSDVKVVGPQMRMDNVIPQRMMGGCGAPYMDDEEDSEDEDDDEEEDDDEDEHGEEENEEDNLRIMNLKAARNTINSEANGTSSEAN